MKNFPEVKGFKKQPYHRSALKPYFERMSKDNVSELWDNHVAVALEKQGFTSINRRPRSVYKVDKLFEALQSFSPNNAPHPVITDDVKSGIRFAYAAFAKPKAVKPFTISDFTVQEINSLVKKPKASAGLTAPGFNKAESATRAYDRGIQIIRGEKKPEPCLALARTQKDDKTRLVWGYPFSMTALEGLFARPLIDNFLDSNSPLAFGKTDGAMSTQMRVAARNCDWAYSIDVHQFDASASQKLINVAFDIIETWFDMDSIERTTGAKASDIFKIIRTYFITCPIVMPDGNVYFGKRHGVPSGSYFTQIVDSIINTIYVGTISRKFRLHASLEFVSVLGDDSLFWSNESVNLADIAKYASEEFDAVFQEKKSAKYYYKQNVRYLGRYWMKGKPNLPKEEILEKMVQPETFRKYAKDPVERNRQVNLLLMSYASVYDNIFWDMWKAVGMKHGFRRYMRMEAWRKFGSEDKELDPQMMSGYQRFIREYSGFGFHSRSTPDFTFALWA